MECDPQRAQFFLRNSPVRGVKCDGSLNELTQVEAIYPTAPSVCRCLIHGLADIYYWPVRAQKASRARLVLGIKKELQCASKTECDSGGVGGTLLCKGTHLSLIGQQDQWVGQAAHFVSIRKKRGIENGLELLWLSETSIRDA